MEISAAPSIKLTANYMLFTVVELLGQILTLAEKNGIKQEYIVQFFQNLIPNPGLHAYLGRLTKRDYEEAGGSVDLLLKDLTLIQTANDEAKGPFHFVSIAKWKALAVIEAGLQDKDLAVWYEFTRFQAGLPSLIKSLTSGQRSKL